jgi:hypothetical protein
MGALMDITASFTVNGQTVPALEQLVERVRASTKNRRR